MVAGLGVPIFRVFTVFHKFLMRENDITPSNFMEMNFDIIKQIKMMSRYLVQ